jgi:hypothetical protein
MICVTVAPSGLRSIASTFVFLLSWRLLCADFTVADVSGAATGVKVLDRRPDPREGGLAVHELLHRLQAVDW